METSADVAVLAAHKSVPEKVWRRATYSIPMARWKPNLRAIGINAGFVLLCALFIGASVVPFLPTSSSEGLGQTMLDGRSVRFLPQGSAEWWVQVRVLGDGGTQATGVD